VRVVHPSQVKGGSVPREFIPSVEKGLASVLGCGPIAGFPVLGLKATLFDGVRREGARQHRHTPPQTY